MDIPPATPHKFFQGSQSFSSDQGRFKAGQNVWWNNTFHSISPNIVQFLLSDHPVSFYMLTVYNVIPVRSWKESKKLLDFILCAVRTKQVRFRSIINGYIDKMCLSISIIFGTYLHSFGFKTHSTPSGNGWYVLVMLYYNRRSEVLRLGEGLAKSIAIDKLLLLIISISMGVDFRRT